ncbi:MAG: glycoside hydrolase family 3 N-terminal domain-containing protein, partial [Mariniphaga sp.]|nr:glycoside hydrolase family 3 N-terminal domain-containing protein [Mariniphaga sp.]
KKWKPGGILMMQSTPGKALEWVNELQENSATPLLVAIDGEWGLSMRLDSTMRYPYAQAVGAIRDSAFIYQMGRDFGWQMKMLGIHMNFAPVADINTNPQNPVINFRSFGEDKFEVSKKAAWIARGMQDAGVVPVAKHFPGHGDTETDSHLELPLIKHDKKRIDAVESFPFRYLAEKGIPGMMTAHLNVPALDPSGTPSSLSKRIITGYLRDEIGYNGLVITDAINMKGIQTGRGNIEVEALIAGNDMVLFVPGMENAVSSVKAAVASGAITREEIEFKCRKVLAVKRWAGLHQYQPASGENLTARLNSPYFEVTKRKLIQNSLTVLVNDRTLPVQHVEELKVASVMIGSNEMTPFQKMLGKYTQVDHFFLPKDATERQVAALRSKLDNYNLVIAGIQGINIYPANKYGTTERLRGALADFIRDNRVIAVFFGNAYALKHFENIHHAKGLILAYQNHPLTQEIAAQLVFGAYDAGGILPVTLDNRFRAGDGIILKKNSTLAYGLPEEVGISSWRLNRAIDSLAVLGIDKQAYPGCQVLIAKDGIVILHKSYGYHTYNKEQEVTLDDIYDWASLTKVTGPLPAIMKLVDEKKMNLDAPFCTYWPDFKGIPQGRFSLRHNLAHQATWPAWIPFWRLGLDENGELDREVFAHQPSDQFSVRVSGNLYLKNNFKDVIFETIKTAKPLPRQRYVYSDLSFYIYPDIISRLTGTPYEEFLSSQFFKPLGAGSVMYNPYLSHPLEQIIPTETDDFFRQEKLRGFVHDEGAAMMGGVSGHAGLFGSANDLAKIFQMYLQKGFFGGIQYISEETMDEFTRIQFPQNQNRRGLGFDKPLINNHLKRLKDAYPATSAGKNSFGHTGYTGTMAWADPDNGVLFVFLSNRVHPTRENPMITELDIRTAMHQAIYDSCITADLCY